MVPEVYRTVSNIQKLGSFRDAASSEKISIFCYPLEKKWKQQKDPPEIIARVSNQIVGPRLCGSDDKGRGAFCASKLLPPTALESNFVRNFFAIGLWDPPGFCKAAGRSLGDGNESGDVTQDFFWEVQNIFHQ